MLPRIKILTWETRSILAPKVKRFYELNKENIDLIVFAGDVLKEPNIDRWKTFYSIFDKELIIYIAPGNHDVSGYRDDLGNNSFDLIKHKSQSDKFPFSFIHDNNLFIIDDSNILRDSLEEIYSIINIRNQYRNIFVIRHHVLPEALRNSANAQGIQPYLKDDFLESYAELNDGRRITFIYGDGGALISRPRIACIKIANVNHIVSGIGEIKGDYVLIINNQEIYRKEID